MRIATLAALIACAVHRIYVAGQDADMRGQMFMVLHADKVLVI